MANGQYDRIGGNINNFTKKNILNILQAIDPMGISDGSINEYEFEANDMLNEIFKLNLINRSNLNIVIDDVFVKYFDEKINSKLLNKISNEILKLK